MNLTEEETKFSREVVNNEIRLVVAGAKWDEYILVLSFRSAAAGTYDLSACPAPCSVYFYGPNLLQPLKFYYASNYDIGSGNITIESLTNDAVKGTFHALCIETTTGDKLTLTNGSFEGRFN